VRGGGGNFGIVTSFEYRLHQVGPLVLGGFLFHPISEAGTVLRFSRDFASAAPDELMVHCDLVTSPQGQPAVAFIVCYSGPMERAEEVVRPLRECGSLAADMVRPMPYAAVQALGGELLPPGRQNYWKSSFIYEVSDEAIDAMIAQFQTVPSPFSVAALEPLGGAVRRVGPDETASGERGAPYSLILAGSWTDPAENDKNIYVHYLDADEQHRVEAAYGRKYERLVALKNRYDPANLFRRNQNIRPTAEGPHRPASA
jgi:Berberine and berberine like